MDGALLARIRWRRRGAWLWPTFLAATVADAVIGNALPPTGDSQSLGSAALVGAMLNLLGIIVLSVPVGALIRRKRTDLPKIVARDYGGTTVISAITVALLAAGIAHQPSVNADQRAMQDAIARAQAWIGDRAPAEFRRNVEWVSAFTIEPKNIYRMCVPNVPRTRTYCVIVKTQLPFASSVVFDGYTPNSVFSQGLP